MPIGKLTLNPGLHASAHACACVRIAPMRQDRPGLASGLAVDGVGVHERPIEVGDFLLIGPRRAAACGCCFDETLEVVDHLVRQDGAGTPAGAVGGICVVANQWPLQ